MRRLMHHLPMWGWVKRRLERERLLVDFEAWAEDRALLVQAEAEGPVPRASEWQDSDDVAFMLLEQAMDLLRGERQ